jgi:hypothetical protein
MAPFIQNTSVPMFWWEGRLITGTEGVQGLNERE